MSTIWIFRSVGMAGILGSLLFMAGDLLYNHIPGSKKSPTEKMSVLPESRILTAGTLGLLGCWFYTLSSWHVYLAFKPVNAVFSIILFFAFAALMICYGISHTAYFSIASGAQTAVKLGGSAEVGGKMGNAFFQRLVYITYIPAGITSLMMAYGMLCGRSLYPIWAVVFLPGLIFLLKAPFVRLLKGRLRELINDCYDNFSFFVYFTASTIVLWNSTVV